MSSSPTVDELLGDAGGGVAEGPRVPELPGTRGPLAIVGEPYEGASKFDREVALWTPPLQSADMDILPNKPTADGRARDALRNDAYVAGGANIHRDNIVGSMFLLNAKPAAKALGLDERWEAEFQEEVESKFMLVAESIENWLDAARMNTLTSLVRLAVGVYLASGEVLASVEWIREGGRPCSTAVQMIDLDRLSNPDGVPETPFLRGGIARNRYGAPVGYHIRMAHPADFTDERQWRWKFVPARKPWGRLQMIHIFEQTRPDQTRGISEMVSALKELRITKQFRDIVLQNAIVNATYAASIESEVPEQAWASLGAGPSDNPFADVLGAYLAAIGTYSRNARNLSIGGVRIPHLFPGTKLQLRPAGQGGPLGTEFERSLLRYIAANLGISYEQLSRDYTNTNYSSARAAMAETWKFMQSRKRMVADRFATAVYRLWLEEMINKGEIASLPRKAPSWYEGSNADAYSQCEWIGASRGQIDELKETQAAVMRIKWGLTTHEDELARLGKDWRKTFAQLEREKALAKERGLEFGDPREGNLNSVSGEPAESEGATDE